MPFKLQGQMVIVTGASRGIGRAIALQCAAQGAKVALAARTESMLQETAQMIRDLGGTALVAPTDVSQYESVQNLVSITQEQLGPADLLVNVAGQLAAIGPVWEVEPSDWRRDLTVNLLGVFHLCRAVVPAMRERNSGRIINIVGGGTRKPFPFVSGYACSKVAVMRLTENLAAELTAVDSAVKAFAVNPGFVRTQMTEKFGRTDAGRKWMGHMIDRLDAGEDVPPELAAKLVLAIARGELDHLHGRYLDAPEDFERLITLRRDADQIANGDERTLRIQ